MLSDVARLLLIFITITSTEPVHQPTTKEMKSADSQSGGWSSWSSWSPCSSTCGQGISSQTRSCFGSSSAALSSDENNLTVNRLKCLGIKSRYVTCQQKPCGIQQKTNACAIFNNQLYRQRTYIWEPYVTAECEVKCRPVGEQLLLTLTTTLQDGTPCPDSGICIKGRCKAIGCDGVIGSNTKLDNCGICGGTNSTCQIVSGLYTRLTLPVGYNVIAQLPVGACNITIVELRLSKNYLALRTQKNGYIINGNWAINWSGEYEAAGTTFHYRRHDLRTQTGEKITAKGPVNQIVELLIIYQQPNPGIKYEYSLAVNQTLKTLQVRPDRSQPEPSVNLVVDEENPVRKKHQRRTNHPNRSDRVGNSINHRRRRREYRWHVVGLGECSKSCGGGVQVTIVACIKRKTAVTVDDNHCHGERKPAMHNVNCNTQACPARWRAKEWSSCSQICGPGTQFREVSCTQGPATKIQESSCNDDEKPESTRNCQEVACFQWKAEEWSQCSSTCGEGSRKRQVHCVSGQGNTVADSECKDQKPSDQEQCIMGSCRVTWFFTEWDTCSTTCGSGTQMRKIFCSSGAVCLNEVKPVSSQTCTNSVDCGSKWFVGDWSQCSTACGTGEQTRDVLCLEQTALSEWKISPETQCSQENQPRHKQSCQGKACLPEWYTSEWTHCSKSCGVGVQTRQVLCLTSDQQIDQECPVDTKPTVQQSCTLANCHSLKQSADCSDKYNNCLLVVRARLCSYDYYKVLCCSSCRT